MALTKRASAWLATLPRTQSVPTARVEQLLRDGGHTPHQAWLTFHDSYAGYAEEVAPGDFAFWGLSHAADRIPPLVWVDPDAVCVVPAKRGFPEGIVCADAHPVHDYELLADGRFMGVGGPAASFDQKIERHGLMMELASRGTVRTSRVGRGLDKQENQDLIHEMRASFVPEASDTNAEFYVEPTRVLRVGRIIDYLVLYEVDPPAPETTP